MLIFGALKQHETYMQRCLELAKLGAGSVAPNPMVGAVLVHEDRIIGEGYHRQYGGPHAEVNCINSVREKDRHLIARAALYVSLEPCAHFGKTPPCADLIVQQKIPLVYIGCSDSYKEVAGKGIEKLKHAGVEVTVGLLEKEARYLNRRFFTFHEKKRPYIILKWAQSADGKIATMGKERVYISNEYTNRLVHRWRSEEAAIMVGTNTALKDDPSLTTRLWTGKNPVRILLDKQLKVPAGSKIYSTDAKTIVFNQREEKQTGHIAYYKLSGEENYLPQIMEQLYQLNLNSLLVEGGARLLQSFIDTGYWDAANVITNGALQIGAGIEAPRLKNAAFMGQETYLSDQINYYRNPLSI